jgi:hypothetical protein
MFKASPYGRGKRTSRWASLLVAALLTPPTLAWAQSADTADCQRIGSIRLVRLDVFDTRIPEEDKALFRLANWLHLQTRESTLQQLLLFKTGDPYDPRLLQETERLLRSTGYLGSAAIRTLACPDGQAEIEVTTQDVWTLKPSLSFGRKGGTNSSSFGIEESNLLGLGTQLGLDIKSGVDRDTRTLYYHDPLLGGQRLDLNGTYAKNSDGKSRSLGLERPFYALDTRWAAGVSWRDETRLDSAYEQGQIVGQYQTTERYAKVYGGLSEGLQDGWVKRWTWGVTHDEHRATPLATNTLPGVTTLTERKLVYPWLGFEWLQDDYQTVRNQDQIGKTEDLQLGWHGRARLGAASPAFGADRSAAVFSLQLYKGLKPWPDTTLLFDASADGRIEREGFAGTLLKASARHYLRQSDRRSLYVALSTERASNPDPDQQVLVGGDTGLRGYPLRYQSGHGRWLFTAEQRYFTDWYPWRVFNVGGAVFYDMGRAWDQNPNTQIPQGLLRDVGFGLRLGNSRSAIGNVVHIDVAFPLDGDRSIRKVQFLVEGKSSF